MREKFAAIHTHFARNSPADIAETKNLAAERPDIAARLAKLVKAEISDDVILTRKDDTFIPLEERTAIANKHKADGEDRHDYA